MTIAGPVRIAVDIGGTFTDLQVLDEKSGATHAIKTPTTPDDPSKGLAEGLRIAARDVGFSLSQVTALMHGTTIATNAVLQRRLAKAALVTTAGFEGILEIGRHVRKDVYANRAEERVLLIPRRHRFGLMERTRADGSIEIPINAAAMTQVIDQLIAAEPEAIAVTLLHAYANADHEERVGEALTKALPGVPLSLSHRICPEIREFERTSTTVLNTMLMPVIREYLTNLRRSLGALGRMTLTRAGTNEITELGSKVSGYQVNRGDVLSLKTSGGGGHGDAGARDANLVLADIADGYVTSGDYSLSRFRLSQLQAS